MLIEKLKVQEKAPETGYLIAYTRKKVFCEPYDSVQSVVEKLKNMELLEIHMFDKDKEYRAIVTESSRFKDGIIEYVPEFSEKDDEKGFVYSEKCYLENVSMEKAEEDIMVLSHFTYDETGMLKMDDYRLSKEGK